jgi:hypothetical protein
MAALGSSVQPPTENAEHCYNKAEEEIKREIELTTDRPYFNYEKSACFLLYTIVSIANCHQTGLVDLDTDSASSLLRQHEDLTAALRKAIESKDYRELLKRRMFSFSVRLSW